jgi:zinc protease
LADKLANLGAEISFGVGTHTVTFNGQCLKKDVDEVIGLLAEQLRYPAFNQEEFDKLKTQFAGGMKQALENTNTQAFTEINRILFPEGHPNHPPKTQEIINDIEKTTLNEVKDFYKKYYGPKSMIMVVVGDIDKNILEGAVNKSFAGWHGGVNPKEFDEAQKVAGKQSVVTIKDKASTTLMFGETTQLKKSDPEYLPLHVANYIFGGNFSARLMSIIRDDEGLTYGIYSFHTRDIYTDGAWYIQGAFNPSLLEKGLESTKREIKRWIEKGVTAEELENKKSTIVGQFKVQLSTTTGIANQVLSFVQRGFDADYIDKYPKLVEALTLDQVNNAIKKYIKPEDIITVMAGSIDENGLPLAN